ncbi:MAG: ATP-binding protein involved in chromosome partitioning [Pirellulaceae bacterium]|jgi:ATP-binding protein involved in chromosome partitioning
MSDAQLEQDIRQALAEIKDPESGRSIEKTGQIVGVTTTDNSASLQIGLTTFSAPLWDETRENIVQHVRSKVPSLSEVTVEIQEHERHPNPLGEVGLLAKNVIAVGSGKGGVGKSTVATSLAYGLKNAGCKVGILDADVFGPSVPHLLGVGDQQPTRGDDNKVHPIYKDGMPVMSMGFMVQPDQAVIWRGPMLHSAITQMLRDFQWGELDYLIIDMPPGTGDVPLSLSQILPLTGAVVVCTPQDVALIDAVKAISMFKTVKIPILGMVENMSGFICPDCDKRHDIFGSGGARAKAEELGTPFLGEIPIIIEIRENGDAGQTAANFQSSKTAPYFEKIIYSLVKNMAMKAEKDPPKPQLPVLG